MTRPAYTVVWEPELYDDFVRLWAEADTNERAFLTHVSNLIDQTLASAPESVGRPWGDMMVWSPIDLEPAAGIVFEIFPADRMVKVSRIILLNNGNDKDDT